MTNCHAIDAKSWVETAGLVGPSVPPLLRPSGVLRKGAAQGCFARRLRTDRAEQRFS